MKRGKNTQKKLSENFVCYNFYFLTKTEIPNLMILNIMKSQDKL